MTAKTHLLGGIIAGELLATLIGAPTWPDAAVLISGAAAGSLIPDIDHLNSKISRSNVASRVTAIAVSTVTHHRGFIHTPAFVALCALLLSSAAFLGLPHGWLLTLALAAGMVSHLILDSLNPGGIMWLWPVSRRRIHLVSIRTRSAGELLVTAALILLALWLAQRYLPEALNLIRSMLPRLP